MSGKYKYETHMHTSEASACGINTAKEMVRSFKDEGYTGIVVTDHFFNGNSAIKRRLPWKKRINDFCNGYKLAKIEGDKIGLDVFFGFESSFNGADLLTYGMDEDFLLKHENLDKYPVHEFINLVHENNGFLIHAHPFRKADYIPGIILFGDKVDAIEVYNASHFDPSFNEDALEYALKLDLPQTYGSDAHNIMTDQRSGIILDKRVENIFGLIEEIKNRNIEFI